MPVSERIQDDQYEELAADIRSWWAQEQEEWDKEILGGTAGSGEGDDSLWNDMPTVDSKTVARMSPIFENRLGRPLDTKLIRPGGYGSIEDVIAHLVPRMIGATQAVNGV